MKNVKLVIYDGKLNLLDVKDSNEEFTKMSIINIEGYEGRFHITDTDNFNGLATAVKIPTDMSEEEYLVKYKKQIEIAQPTAKRIK
jgi:hypothetical protein